MRVLGLLVACILTTLTNAQLSIVSLKLETTTPASTLSTQTYSPNHKLSPISLTPPAKLQIKLSLKDEGGPVNVQAVLLVLENQQQTTTLVFKSLRRVGGYSLNLDHSTRDILPKTYKVSLHIIPFTNKPLSITPLLDSLTLDHQSPNQTSQEFTRKPDLFHTFRKQEKLPNEFTSMLFTLAVLSPWFLLTYIWKSLITINKFSSPYLSGTLFMGCLFAFLGLFYAYFVYLNVFEFLIGLAGLGGMSVFVGWWCLSARALLRVSK